MNADRASQECIQNEKITYEDCRFKSEEWDIVDFSLRVWTSWPKRVVYSQVNFFLTSLISLPLSLAVDIMDICHGSEYSGQSKYDLFCVLPALFPTLMIPTLTSLVSGTSKCACYSKLVGKEYFQCFQINSQDYLCSKVCKFIHIFKLTFNTAIGKRREKKEENTLCPLPWALEGNSPM